jgi:hypothetical protein
MPDMVGIGGIDRPAPGPRDFAVRADAGCGTRRVKSQFLKIGTTNIIAATTGQTQQRRIGGKLSKPSLKIAGIA